MRNCRPSTPLFTALATACLMAWSSNTFALDEAGTIKTLKGTASIEREGQKVPALIGSKIMVSDRILTGAESSIGITLRDNTLLSAGANSTLVINRFAFDTTTHVGQLTRPSNAAHWPSSPAKSPRLRRKTSLSTHRPFRLACAAQSSSLKPASAKETNKMSPLIPLIAIAVAVIIQQPASDRVVLLPDAEGKVGEVIVRSSTEQQLLDTAYAATEINGKGSITQRKEDAASVQTRYGALLGARPPRPESFMVNFVTGSAQELTPESQQVLEHLKTSIAQRPAPEISVIGHTDRVGKLEDNDALSLKRAESVKAMLQAAGIQAEIEVSGRGEREPQFATEDEVAESANRRVEINLR